MLNYVLHRNITFLCIQLQGHPSHGVNEAEIFIIPILGGNLTF